MSVFSYLNLNRFLAKDKKPDNGLSLQEFMDMRQSQDVIIDVRSPGEYLEGHVQGAVNHNMSSMKFKAQVEPLDRDRTYYLYCRSGNRSGLATAMMRQMGFEKVYNVGALSELEGAGFEIVEG